MCRVPVCRQCAADRATAAWAGVSAIQVISRSSNNLRYCFNCEVTACLEPENVGGISIN